MRPQMSLSSDELGRLLRIASPPPRPTVRALRLTQELAEVCRVDAFAEEEAARAVRVRARLARYRAAHPSVALFVPAAAVLGALKLVRVRVSQ